MRAKPARLSMKYSSRRNSLEALGMAMMASSAGVRWSRLTTSRIGPSTGTPSMRRPILSGSSSRKATMVPNTPFARISRAMDLPAKPAPTM